MRLNEIVLQYVAFRKSMAKDFTSAESLLKTFCRYVGEDIELTDVEAEHVQEFLTGTGTLSGLLASQVRHVAGSISLCHQPRIRRPFAAALHSGPRAPF